MQLNEQLDHNGAKYQPTLYIAFAIIIVIVSIRSNSLFADDLRIEPWWSLGRAFGPVYTEPTLPPLFPPQQQK